MKKIWGNMIIKNEDLYVWFAIMSVINYVEKLLIWDTGSTDKTIDIIKQIINKYPTKIVFREIGPVTPSQLTQAREKMLNITKSDWILIIDGDEVWWESSIKKLTLVIQEKGDNFYATVSPVINVIGDIFHYQEMEAGEYNLMGKRGHFNIRAVNKHIPGLHLKNEYPLEGFFDKDERLIQDIKGKLLYINTPLLHFSHLSRSSTFLGDQEALLRNKKIKYELGKSFPSDFKYPEVFYIKKPRVILSPWTKMSRKYFITAALLTPFKKIKRRIRKLW